MLRGVVTQPTVLRKLIPPRPPPTTTKFICSVAPKIVRIIRGKMSTFYFLIHSADDAVCLILHLIFLPFDNFYLL